MMTSVRTSMLELFDFHHGVGPCCEACVVLEDAILGAGGDALEPDVKGGADAVVDAVYSAAMLGSLDQKLLTYDQIDCLFCEASCVVAGKFVPDPAEAVDGSDASSGVAVEVVTDPVEDADPGATVDAASPVGADVGELAGMPDLAEEAEAAPGRDFESFFGPFARRFAVEGAPADVRSCMATASPAAVGAIVQICPTTQTTRRLIE